MESLTSKIYSRLVVLQLQQQVTWNWSGCVGPSKTPLVSELEVQFSFPVAERKGGLQRFMADLKILSKHSNLLWRYLYLWRLLVYQFIADLLRTVTQIAAFTLAL